MEFRTVSEQEWRCLQDSQYQHERIQARVGKILDWLSTVFNDKSPGGVSGLQFQKLADNDVVCSIVTPMGHGRLRLEWILFRSQLHGLLIVERKLRDELDQLRWKQVWQLNIPDDGSVFVVEPGDGYALRQGIGKHLENDVFALGMSILFAIVAGPVSS